LFFYYKHITVALQNQNSLVYAYTQTKQATTSEHISGIGCLYSYIQIIFLQHFYIFITKCHFMCCKTT